MILHSDFDTVIDCYSKLNIGSKVQDAPFASILLASQENNDSGLFENGIKYQGCFFWFASIPMMVACFNHHANELKLKGTVTDEQLKSFLALFKGKEDESLCMKYKDLYDIKNAFVDQVTKKGNLILTGEEWCDTWFRDQERGISASSYKEFRKKNLPQQELTLWLRTVYSLGGGITLRTLIEARNNPDFQLVHKWTADEPCPWFDKLVPKNHPLAKNIGKWVQFTNSDSKYGYQKFPYRLVYLERNPYGEVVYHAENQLTLPAGVRINPSKVTIISEAKAKELYQASIKSHPPEWQTWGGAPITKLWNPKNFDFKSEFYPTLTEATWHEFSKCHDYSLVDGKKTYTPSELKTVLEQRQHKNESDKFRFHMDDLRSLTVEEYVFRKKYIEIADDNTSPLELRRRSDRIWRPRNIRDEATTIKEIEELNPAIILVETHDRQLWEDWRILRLYCHTMDFDPIPARFLRFLVVDTKSEKYLGVVSIGSDVLALGARDEYIGCSINKHSRHSAIGSCIMATQPFGYNFLGGKLVASILTTKSVRDLWKERYGDTLVGFTTTALYGASSMYNGIPWWHTCGESGGKMSVTPDDEYLNPWKEYLKERLGPAYQKLVTKKDGSPVTAAKQKLIKEVFKQLEMKAKDYEHGYQRGVYYSGVYENFKEFFQGKIGTRELVLSPKFVSDVQGVIDWWKPKAIKRYQTLLQNGRINDQPLFYYRLKKSPKSAISYDEAMALYMRDVGR